MTELEMVLAYVAPLATIGAAAWKMSARLAKMDEKLARLEQENRNLHAEIGALRTLLSVIVDSRRAGGNTPHV